MRNCSVARVAALIVAGAICMSLVACGIIPISAPKNLNIVSLRIGANPPIKDVGKPEKTSLPGTIAVEFTTTTDLISYHVNSTTVHAVASFCTPSNGVSPSTVPYIDPYVYWLDTAIDGLPQPDSRYLMFLAEKQAPSFTYRVFIDLKGPGYDLEKEPRDICIKLTGGNELSMIFTSKTLVLSKEAIAKLLQGSGNLWLLAPSSTGPIPATRCTLRRNRSARS